MEYHKINSLFKRDPQGKHVLWGQYSRPEFEYLKGSTWLFTEKVDGMNIRVKFMEGGRCDVAGKTDRALIPGGLLGHLIEKFGNKDPLPAGTVLYGEGYGAGIQKGGGYRDDQGFILFDVLLGLSDRMRWLSRDEVTEVARRYDVPFVPLIGKGNLDDLVTLVGSGFKSGVAKDDQLVAEGVVARPEVELADAWGGRIITKLKFRDFKESKPF